jgi:hypothetical protein
MKPISSLLDSHFMAEIENVTESLSTLHLIFKQQSDCALETKISILAIDKQGIDAIISCLMDAREAIK